MASHVMKSPLPSIELLILVFLCCLLGLYTTALDRLYPLNNVNEMVATDSIHWSNQHALIILDASKKFKNNEDNKTIEQFKF
jgi:hypothetical protein